MQHDRGKCEAGIRICFEVVVFADTEASIFNVALGVVDAIVSGGTYTLQYIQSELGDFGIKIANEMINAGVNPVNEPIYSDVMTFHNWEQPIKGTKIYLPNKFVPYVAARKRKVGSGGSGMLLRKPSEGKRPEYLQRVKDHAEWHLTQQTGSADLWNAIHNAAKNDTGETSGLRYLERVQNHAEWYLIEIGKANLWEEIHRSALQDVGEA